ncbi:MAG: hypothetical protein WDM92_09640 [Caulobacteraceae bacterium]
MKALSDKVEVLQDVAARQAAAPAPAPPPPPPEPIAAARPAPAPAETPNPIIQTVANAPSGGVSIVAGKPSIQSADGRFTPPTCTRSCSSTRAFYSRTRPGRSPPTLRRGAAAGDTAHARDLNSGTDFRRARLGVDGKLFGDFE